MPVWEYHVAVADYRLLGCRFSAGATREEGELIVYEGEASADGIRIPRKRTWSNHSDGKVIGVDEIVEYTRSRVD